MRNFFLILLVLLLLAAGAIAFFALTFNADRYRPLIQQKVQEALGRPVEMDRISLGWEEGLALEIKGLTIYQTLPSRVPFLRLDSAAVKISPAPLLRHELQVSSVIIDSPEIKLTRSPSGRILELSEPPSDTAETKSEAGQTPPASAALSFFVDLIKIKNGSVHFVDQSPANPVDIKIQDIDIMVRDISLTNPLSLDARAAVFSSGQNLSLDGKLKLMPKENGVIVQDVTASIDLSHMEAAKLLKAIPALQQVGLAQGLAGQLEIKVNRLRTVQGNVVELDSEAHLVQGSIKTARMPLPLENYAADLSATRERVILQSFSGNLGRGRIQAAGKIEQLNPLPQTQFQISLEGLDFTELAPPASSEAVYLAGKLSGELNGAAQGASAPLIQRTFSGKGVFDLQGLILMNMNVLREILKNLARVPAIGQSIENRLPEDYRQKLQAEDTLFAPVQIPVLIQQGSAFFDHVTVEAESFSVVASGRVGLAGGIQMSAVLTLDQELSAALIGGINELQYLTDAQGRLQIPLIQPPGPKFTLIPDISYIASKLAVGKGREVIGNMIQNRTGLGQQQSGTSQQGYNSGYGSQNAQSGTTDYRKMKGSDLLGQFLQNAIQSQGTGESSQS